MVLCCVRVQSRSPHYGCECTGLGISSIKFAFANRFILDVADFFSEMVDMQKALSLASHKRNEINELNRQVAADEDKDPTTSCMYRFVEPLHGRKC